MASSIPMLTPGPDACLNPLYDNRGYNFTMQAVRAMQTPPSFRSRVLNFSDQLLYSGAVSWSPVTDTTGAGAWTAFEALHYVMTNGPFGGYFWAANAHNLTDVQIGVGDGTTRVFQIRRSFTNSSHTFYKNVYFPIHGWSSAISPRGTAFQNTLVVKVDGVLETHWTVVNTTGVLAFDSGHAPGDGLAVTVSCEYVHPVFPMDVQPEVSWTADLAYIKDYRIMEIPQ